jgi:hypothetical protein
MVNGRSPHAENSIPCDTVGPIGVPRVTEMSGASAFSLAAGPRLRPNSIGMMTLNRYDSLANGQTATRDGPTGPP